MSATWIVIAVVVVICIGLYVWYVSLIGRRNKALEALSSIDVQLRKRHDLLPNILKIASRFMEHERDLLQKITEQRAAAMKEYKPSDPGAVQEHLSAAGALQGSMMRFFAVAENYPDLKSQETMVTAQATYTEVEGHIAAARRFYNAAVTQLNNSVQIFPGSAIAKMANVQEMPFFEETDDAVKAPVDASDFLK